MATPTAAQGTWLSAEEAGYLTAGPERAAETVLARLVDTGLARVSRAGKVSAVHQDGRGATTSIEERMLRHTRAAVSFDSIVRSTADSAEMADLYRQLLTRGLMQVPRRNDGWWFSLAVAGVSVVLGFVAPVFFLGALIGLGFFVRQYGRGPVTKAGRDALRHVTAGDRVHAVALHGFSGRVRGQNVTELFDLPRNVVWTVPPKARARRRSTSDRHGSGSAASCGSGSSSSCSSSSSCGGGGCGGGGGGD
ncbi:TIGR04222 domain-containing membrane protein [Streptomyces sp. ID05-26A]|nr:TIGR04222 domain-containing membrane protein [Streptomyces sp. ID05-26A]